MANVNDTATKNALLSTLISQISTGGKIRVYQGATVLAELTSLSFGTPASGSVTFTGTADSSNDASGTADAVKLLKSDNTVVITFTSGEFTIGPVVLSGTTTLTSGTLSVA
jgi:hypothetical protein